MEKTDTNGKIQTNLVEHLKEKGYPPIYESGPQVQKARDLAASLKSAMERNKSVDEEDKEWYKIYKRAVGKVEESFEGYFKHQRSETPKETTIEDVKETLVDWAGKLQVKITESMERVMTKAMDTVKESYKEAINAHKEANTIMKGSLDTMGRYYVDLSTNQTKASDNASKALSSTLSSVTTLVSEVMKAFSSQVQSFDELSKKKVKQLMKFVEDREHEKPGGFDQFTSMVAELGPVITEGLKAGGKEVPPAILAALDKLKEIKKSA